MKIEEKELREVYMKKVGNSSGSFSPSERAVIGVATQLINYLLDGEDLSTFKIKRAIAYGEEIAKKRYLEKLTTTRDITSFMSHGCVQQNIELLDILIKDING